MSLIVCRPMSVLLSRLYFVFIQIIKTKYCDAAKTDFEIFTEIHIFNIPGNGKVISPELWLNSVHINYCLQINFCFHQ